MVSEKKNVIRNYFNKVKSQKLPPLKVNRRQRLEFALSILPYDYRTIKLSDIQQKAEQVIAQLRTEESSAAEESDEDKARKATGFAEETMRQIEQSDDDCPKTPQKMLGTLATLTLAAEKLMKQDCKTERRPNPEDSDDDDDDDDEFENPAKWAIHEEMTLVKVDQRELLENSIQSVNEARFKLFQRWECSKRKALDMLTIEIDKIQDMEDIYGQRRTRRVVYNAGSDEHKTPSPKTNDEENMPAPKQEQELEQEHVVELDDDDEEYVPRGRGGSGKRKRAKKPVTSTPNAKRLCPKLEFDNDSSSAMVTIGPNGTQISRACLQAINWSTSGPAITRKLLCEIFDRATLAFHTLSGKPSPAFKDCARPSKQQLDPQKVADLVYLMTNSMEMTPREVRTAITTKCADENKMLRTRQQRRPRKTV